jgi:hypothetical protein
MSDTENNIEDKQASDSEGSGDDEPEYEVERIVKKRVKGSKVEYEIKWKNYPESDNTWEPVEHLTCTELLADFEAQAKKKADKEKEKKKPGPASASKAASSAKKPEKKPEEEKKAETSTSKRRSKADSPVPVPDSTSNKRKKTSQAPSVTDDEGSSTPTRSGPKEKKGFERGLAPEKIIGATDSNGQLMFLMKWEGTEDADLVFAKDANSKCPQIVIKFYEERLTWHSNSEENN